MNTRDEVTVSSAHAPSSTPVPSWHTCDITWPEDLDLHLPLDVQAYLSGPTSHRVSPKQILNAISTHVNPADGVIDIYRYEGPRKWYLNCPSLAIKDTLLRLPPLSLGDRNLLRFTDMDMCQSQFQEILANLRN